MTTSTLKKKVIEYPESDGKPMAETDAHRDWMFTNINRLKRFFARRKVYVSGNLLIYYVKGDTSKCVAPDTFAVKNCEPGERKIFKIWEERRKPTFALETTSKTTRKEDTGEKKTKYALIGIKEYFLYDPFGEWLKPPLQGFSLVRGAYESIAPDAERGVTSKELGIRFLLEDGALAMFDAKTGERLLTDEEWESQRADEEKRRADKEKQRAGEEKRRADEEKRRADEEKQRADKEKQRAGQEKQRAVEERQRADEESQRADEEKQRAHEEKRRADEAEQKAKALEEEIARLKESIGKLDG
jgi:Uma2 family endonuclease